MNNLSKKLISIISLAAVSSSLIVGTKINVKAAETGAQSITASTVNTDLVKSNSGTNGLASKMSDGAILHAWCWSFNTIKNNMADIAASGYTSVQTSPASACIVGAGGSKNIANWYWHYQPTNYTVGNYQLGSEDDFKAMTAEAKKYGVKIVVDIVANHMTSDWNSIDPSWQNRSLFHTNEQVGNWNDRKEVTQKALLGLWDLNTQSSDVQSRILSYLKTLVADGASGFRYDAAKHIELPSDSGFGGNFWPTITQNGSEFQYGEILQDGISNESGYSQYIGVTASNYGKALRDAIGNGSISASTAQNTQIGVDSSKIVTWVESHDNYANGISDWGSSQWMNDSQIKKVWAVIGARQAGTPLFFSRPKGGGASNGDNRFPGQSQIGDAGSDLWKDPEVVAVNKFRNAMEGQGESFEDNNGTLVIKRGSKGVTIINWGGDKTMNVQVSMPDGTYTDQAHGGTFTVSGGKLTGSLGSGKIAVIYSPTDGSTTGGSTTGGSTTGGSTTGGSTTGGSTTGGSTTGGITTPISVSSTAVYFKKPSGWGDNINAYVYTGSGSSAAKNDQWPGVAMTKEADGSYSYEVPDSLKDGVIIFSDGKNQYPAAQQAGVSIQLGKIFDISSASWNTLVSTNTTATTTTGGSTTGGSTTGTATSTTGTATTTTGGSTTGTTTQTPATITLNSDSSSYTLGKTINLSGKASDNGNYTYRFRVVSDSITKNLTDFTASSNYAWSPSAAGTYKVFVEAKNATGTVIKSDYTTIEVVAESSTGTTTTGTSTSSGDIPNIPGQTATTTNTGGTTGTSTTGGSTHTADATTTIPVVILMALASLAVMFSRKKKVQ